MGKVKGQNGGCLWHDMLNSKKSVILSYSMHKLIGWIDLATWAISGCVIEVSECGNERPIKSMIKTIKDHSQISVGKKP